MGVAARAGGAFQAQGSAIRRGVARQGSGGTPSYERLENDYVELVATKRCAKFRVASYIKLEQVTVKELREIMDE